MYILGINDGHNSGASIFLNGKLICAFQGRLSRKKKRRVSENLLIIV